MGKFLGREKGFSLLKMTELVAVRVVRVAFSQASTNLFLKRHLQGEQHERTVY